MAKITIHFEECEFNALDHLAELEYRTIQAQAAIIINKTLEQLGLLSNSDSKKDLSTHSAEKILSDVASISIQQ